MSKWSVTIHQSNRNGSSSPKCRWVVDPPGYNHKNRNWGDHDGMTDVYYFDGDPTHRQWKSEWEEI